MSLNGRHLQASCRLHRMDSEYVLNSGKLSPRIIIGLLVWLAGCWMQAVADPAAFDRPAELEADIEFWRQVFSQIDSHQAYLHDSRHLNVVYETVRIPPGSRARDRRRIADQVRDRYRKTLQKLAKGQRKGLNAEEQRILHLWPADISNDELKEAAKRIRFQQGLADNFRAGLQRAGAWQPYITEQLRQNNVPIGLAALPHVESSFNPVARSHVGAAGLWQFTRATGKRFMQVDHVVDERRDPFRSSEAAAELLAHNYSILESWPLAITAYNHGVAGMRRAVRNLGTEDIAAINREYKGRTFGFASRNFYVAFLAAMDVEADAEKYFGVIESDVPRDDVVITLPRYVPVRSVAAAAGVSTKQLRETNPALLQPVWDGTKHVPRSAVIRIPAATTDLSGDAIIAAIPASERYVSQTPDQFHKVQNGEALSVIARRYNVSVSELVALNGLKSRHKIRAGQTLRLPFAGVSIPEGALTYKVQWGDSLSVIARDAGISQSRLMELNGLKDKHRIYVGQTLYLRPPEDKSASGGDSDA